MLLVHGKAKELSGLPWAAIEVSEAGLQRRGMRIDEVAVRIALWCSRRFPSAELLLPVKNVTVRGITTTIPYLLGRIKDIRQLKGVQAIFAVEGLTSDEHGNPLPIEDGFVQSLIEQERAGIEWRASNVKKGTWCRVLWGPERMLVGHVVKSENGIAEVQVELKSRKIRLLTGVTALEPLQVKKKVPYYYRGE